MRIGMILDNSFPPDPRVENEALTLNRNGHEVFLFCFDYNGKLQEQEIINGIQINRRKVSKFEYKLSALAYTFPFYHFLVQKDIEEFAIINRIEMFHIHDIQIARSVFDVNKKLKLPIVLDLHENRPEIMKFYAHVNSYPGKLLIKPAEWKKYEYQYIKKSDKVIVVTDEAKKYYSENIPESENKFHVVPNSVRKDFYSSYQLSENIINKYRDNFTILYIGDTGQRRGIETAIESLTYVISEIPNIKLVVVGSSKTHQLLKIKVRHHHLEEFVDLTGWQNPELFQSYILSSDIGICPLHRNLHHDTTYANKLFQYMAFGKPLIVSNSTAQERLIIDHECGLVFTDRDSREMADCILKLYRNKEVYNILSKNGKDAIENHLNWEMTSKELINLYKEL